MKKILFIVNLDTFFISHRLPVAISLKNHGYEVHIATKFTTKENYLKSLGFYTHQLPIERTSLSIFSNFLTFINIFQLIKIVSPNLLHLITIKPILLGGISSYFFKNISVVVSVSGLGFVFSDKGKFSFLRRTLISKLYKFALLNKKITVIFQNKEDRNTLLKITNLKKENTKLIYGSGVDLKTYSVKSDEKTPPIVLFASRLLISKGIIDFIESSKYLENIRFVISGGFDFDNPDCVDKGLIEKMSKQGYIEYWGYSEKMEEIINQSSIVVLPSYYGEGLPKILIEAAACGKPVITTDHPGCRDAIIENTTGLLVPIKSPKSIASAINYILANKEIKTSMGIHARLLAEKRYSIDHVIEQHLVIYRALIG